MDDKLKESHKVGLLNELLEFGYEIPVVNKTIPYARKAVIVVKKDVIIIIINMWIA